MTARRLIDQVNLNEDVMRVLVHRNHLRLFTAMRSAMQEALPLVFDRVLTSSQVPASGIVTRLSNSNPGVDAVLVDDTILRAIQATPVTRQKVGELLLRL